MSTPSPGHRDNGLPGHDWAALVDLDPRLSETVLASLAAAGVAAYVEPASGLDAFTRAAQLPGRPLDRLWIDPARADAAREVVSAEVSDLTQLLHELEPGATAHGFMQAVPRTAARRVLTPPTLPDPPRRPAPDAAPAAAAPEDRQPGAADDPDAAWRAIVEGFGREHDGPIAPWPVSEDVDAPGRTSTTRPEHEGDSSPRRRRGDTPTQPPSAEPGRPASTPAEAAAPKADPRASRDPDALPAWLEPEAVEDEGHYLPPPPPPVPRPTPRRALAILVFALGVVLMFAPGAIGQPSTSGVATFGVLLTVAGAAAFVYLLRDTSDESGPDDGAIV